MLLARIIHHSRGASLGSRHHSAFASLTNTGSICSVIESVVMTTTFAIRSLSGELSRIVKRVIVFIAFSLVFVGACATTNSPRDKEAPNCLKRCEQLGVRKSPNEWKGDRVPGMESSNLSPCEKKCYSNSSKLRIGPKKKKPDGFKPTPTGY